MTSGVCRHIASSMHHLSRFVVVRARTRAHKDNPGNLVRERREVSAGARERIDGSDRRQNSW